jgi:hypothetical protein
MNNQLDKIQPAMEPQIIIITTTVVMVRLKKNPQEK